MPRLGGGGDRFVVATASRVRRREQRAHRIRSNAEVHRQAGDGVLRHVRELRVRGVLHDREAAARVNSPQARRAVVEHAAHEHADHPRSVRPRRRAEQWVDRGPAPVLLRPADHAHDAAVDEQMPIGRCDPDLARDDGIVVRGVGGPQRTRRGEDIGEEARALPGRCGARPGWPPQNPAAAATRARAGPRCPPPIRQSRRDRDAAGPRPSTPLRAKGSKWLFRWRPLAREFGCQRSVAPAGVRNRAHSCSDSKTARWFPGRRGWQGKTSFYAAAPSSVASPAGRSTSSTSAIGALSP